MNKNFFLILVLIVIVTIVAGCSSVDGNDYGDNDDNKEEDSSAKEKILSIDPDPGPDEKLITLYFKHKYSDYLVPEVRSVTRNKHSWEQVIVEELLKGPSQHDRSSVMPLGIKVLDVTRKGETVFVNLSQELNSDIDLSGIPGKEDVPEEKRGEVKAEMKRLGIYSLVNSLTELEGITQVKLLVDNRSISYGDLDEDFANLMFPQSLDEVEKVNNIVVALSRDRSYILTPSISVQTVFEGMIGEPKWDIVYSLLSRETASKDHLPSREELERLWPVLINNIELEDNFILDEEIKADGRAFVTVSFSVNYASGKKEKMDNNMIIVVDEDNIWKVKLPEFVSDFR
ncbi:MAG TPA: GerMN domain-containing protein [Clostridia bacterium]|nr:GerMN domain-containing protein [Clostridia bacterium]